MRAVVDVDNTKGHFNISLTGLDCFLDNEIEVLYAVAMDPESPVANTSPETFGHSSDLIVEQME